MNREEAITTLKEMYDSFDEIHENTNYEIGYEQMTALDMAIEALSNNITELPNDAIKRGNDVIKRADAVQGEWLIHGEPPMYVIECSQCGQKYFNHALQEKANFCSNCGARMENRE